MIGDIRPDEAERQAERLRSSGLHALAITLDVTDPVSVADAAEECTSELGEIDVLVANAGILRLGPALDMDLATWRAVIDVNLTGVFVCCQEFARRMVLRGRGGRIVVMSSLFGRRGGRDNTAYSASKFGAIGLAESLAAELAPHAILVNTICPGQVDTEMMREVVEQLSVARGISPEQVASQLVEKIPLGRMAAPQDVADVAVYLASHLSGYVTGQSLIVDGGMQVG